MHEKKQSVEWNEMGANFFFSFNGKVCRRTRTRVEIDVTTS